MRNVLEEPGDEDGDMPKSDREAQKSFRGTQGTCSTKRRRDGVHDIVDMTVEDHDNDDGGFVR